MTLIGCLMLLDKVVKEPRDPNSQLKCSINDLRAPMHALRALALGATGLKLVKIKYRTSFCH